MNVHQPHTSKNFVEFSEREIKQNVSYTLGHASCVDLVFDVYRTSLRRVKQELAEEKVSEYLHEAILL